MPVTHFAEPGPASMPSGVDVGPEGLRVSAVSHAFHDRRHGVTAVLDDVSLEVNLGEFVALMGPSGCGKSTLLTMVAGFLRPDHGSVSWLGAPIAGPDPTRGFVFQKPQLYPWLDVYGNIMFGPSALGRARESRELAQQLISEVGLEGFERHHPYQLSGGMQHRVALARTLVNRPALLLMDEPFAALDAQTREEMQALLLDIWQKHRSTVVFVTHDIEEGLLLADRVAIMGHRPGQIRANIDVPFDRPRSDSLVLEPDFVEIRGDVRNLFRREVV